MKGRDTGDSRPGPGKAFNATRSAPMKKTSFRVVDASFVPQSTATVIATEMHVLAGALQRLQGPIANAPLHNHEELNIKFAIMTKTYIECFACYCAAIKHELDKSG
jgi:hypothetical protein